MGQSNRVYGGRGSPDLRFLLITVGTLLGVGRADRRHPTDDAVASLMDAADRLGRGGAALVVDEVFCECLERVWEGGWQPEEAVRVVRRRLTSRHADLAATAVAAGAGVQRATIGVAPPRYWRSQLEELGAADQWWGRGRDWLAPWALRAGLSWPDALQVTAESLGVLLRLPKAQILLPPPSKWALGDFGDFGGGRGTADIEDSVLAKVRALLAKAESTTFEHEADALTAKAQELMARHSIDEAIAHSRPGRAREIPEGRRIPVDDPYATAKSTLLAVVAAANNVRAVWDPGFALMTLVGFETDLESVAMLFTSLLMQASNSMLAKGQVSDGRGRSRTRSFRQSFYVAFAGRIHERLEMATHEARVGAERDLGCNLLPVLASRKDDVDDTTTKMFPHLSKGRRTSVSNPDGWRAGRAAAEMATLGPVHQRLTGTAG